MTLAPSTGRGPSAVEVPVTELTQAAALDVGDRFDRTSLTRVPESCFGLVDYRRTSEGIS